MEIYPNPEILADDAEMDRLGKALLGFGHPVRARCLVLLAKEHSPSELFEMQSTASSPPSLGTVSYHVRMLRDYGLVEEVRVQPRRGALEHFYVRTELADEVLNALAPIFGLPRSRRRRPAAVAA